MAGRPYPAAMSQTINLNRVRKQKAREAARRLADANAATHGRSKAEKQREAAEAERAARHLDQHRQEKPGDD